MQENRYNTCDRFLGGLEKDFIITEQIEDSPLTSEPSFLDYWIIAVCNRGSAIIHLLDNKHVWNKNELIFLFPRQLCSMRNVSEDFSAKFIIIPHVLHGDVLSSLRHFDPGFHFFVKDHFYYNIEDNNGIERFQSFCKLIENELERYRGNGLLRERIICYLGIFYMDVYDYYVKVRKKIPFRTSLRKEQLIYDFCSLVAENFKNHKNVGFYADKLNITTTYLSAIMNERCGISAKEFLSIYIVLEVKSLLRDSRLNIQEIAILTNFPSQSTLNRFFRQRTGMTLSQYRKHIFST
mgnify:FL=1